MALSSRVLLALLLAALSCSLVSCQISRFREIAPNGVAADYITLPAAVALTAPTSLHWVMSRVDSLQEIDSTGTVVAAVQGLPGRNWAWSLPTYWWNPALIEVDLSSSELAVTPVGQHPPFSIEFLFSTFLYLQDDTQTFLDETITGHTGQLKWQLSVSGWKFQSPANKLRLVMHLTSWADFLNQSTPIGPTNGTNTTAPPTTPFPTLPPINGTNATTPVPTTPIPTNFTNSTTTPLPTTTTPLFQNLTTSPPPSTNSTNATTTTPIPTTPRFNSTNTTTTPIPTTLPSNSTSTTTSAPLPFNTTTTTPIPTTPPAAPLPYILVQHVPGTLSSKAIIFANSTANLIIPTMAMEDGKPVRNIAVNVSVGDQVGIAVAWEFPAFNETLVYDPILAVTDLLPLPPGSTDPTNSTNTTAPPSTTLPIGTTLPRNFTLPPVQSVATDHTTVNAAVLLGIALLVMWATNGYMAA